MFSLTLSFILAKDCVNLNIFTVVLLIVCQMTKYIVLTVQCFYLQKNKGPPVLLSTRYKIVVIIFHKNQRVNIGNQHYKEAAYLTTGIIEKFEELQNITSHQIDETLKERQMKCPKIV